MTTDAANFTVKAKSVAVVSALVAMGSLAALSIVVSVKDVDILSTVALALAILAFVVQIIVYVVQSASASQQLADARYLHGEMMSVLAELQTRSAGTQRSIESLQDQMINDLRRKAAGPDAEPLDAHAVTAVAVEAARSRLSGADNADIAIARSQLDEATTEYPGGPDAETAAAIVQELTTWPSVKEMEEKIAPLFESKDDHFLNALRWVVTDARNFVSSQSIGPGVDIANPSIAALVEEGLAEKIPGWKLATASARGRDVGRVFTAPGPPPPGTPAPIVAARERFLPQRQDPHRFRER